MAGQEPAIGGFKTDDGEALNSNPSAPYIPKTAAYFNGETGAQMQNGYLDCLSRHRLQPA